MYSTMRKTSNYKIRKYFQDSNGPLNLCETYKVPLRLTDQAENLTIQAQAQMMNEFVLTRNHQPTEKHLWSQINQHEQFGYDIAPESPASYFKDDEMTNDEVSPNSNFDSPNTIGFVSWDDAQNNDDAWY